MLDESRMVLTGVSRDYASYMKWALQNIYFPRSKKPWDLSDYIIRHDDVSREAMLFQKNGRDWHPVDEDDGKIRSIYRLFDELMRMDNGKCHLEQRGPEGYERFQDV